MAAPVHDGVRVLDCRPCEQTCSNKRSDQGRQCMTRTDEVRRTGCAIAAGAAMVMTIGSVSAQQQQRIGALPESMNMRLVGYSDLQERSAYQPTIHRQGDRYIAY